MMPKLALAQQQAADDSKELTDTMRLARADLERRVARIREMANDYIRQHQSQRRQSRDNLRPVKP